MDLKAFYEKVRQAEAVIEEAHAVVMSLETPDGGRAGVPGEVLRAVAARMIVEGKARLATSHEADAFRKGIAEARRAAEDLMAAGRMQIVISEASLQALKGSSKTE